MNSEVLAAAVISENTGWWVVIILGILWVGLGVFWGRKSKDSEGFMLAGRNVGVSLGSATAMATWVTSNTTMLAPAFAMKMGVWGVLAYSTASFGLILFSFFAVRIRKILPDGYTAGDFFRLRFGKMGWVLFMLITMVYSMAWLVSMAIAGGDLMQAIAGIPYKQGMTLILIVCVLYTIFGGLYAVIGTDFVQSLIILIGIVVIGGLVATKIDFDEAYTHISTYQPSLLTIALPAALLAVFNNMLFGFGEVFHNNVWWSRAYAMREGVSRKAFLLSGFLWFPIPIAAGFIALAAGPLDINIVTENQTGPTVASAVMVDSGLGMAAGIIILIVLFCSMASSIDSLLAATSDLLLKDVLVSSMRVKLTDRRFRIFATMVILLVGCIAWTLAIPHWNIIEVLFLSGPLVGSLIWPVIAGLFWKQINRNLILIGIVSGSALGVLAYYLLGWFTASLIGTGVSMLFTILARFISPSPFPESNPKD